MVGPPVRLGVIAVTALALLVTWSDLPTASGTVGLLAGGASGLPAGAGAGTPTGGGPGAAISTTPWPTERAVPGGPSPGSPGASATAPSAEAAATASPAPARTATPPTSPRPQTPRPATPPPAPTGWQPSFPIRAAFYYPWFPQAWSQSGYDPYTRYRPSLGYYDGAAASVVATQIGALRYAGVQVGIASWWGQGTLTDTRIPLLLKTASAVRFRWTLYYEAEAYGDPSATQIASDLAYIARRYASSPSFLRIGGRPVIFVYASGGDGCSMAQRWKAANATAGFYVVLKVFAGYRGCSAQPSGWHQYAAASRSDSQRGYSFSVSPGFWLITESAPRLARDPAAFASAVRAMVASDAPFQLITTFNEWGEGTAVESATQWSSGSGYGTYLDILHAGGR